MLRTIRWVVLVLLPLLLACETTYYSAMEQVGVHKRDILRDRVEEARDAQSEAQEEFKSALEQLTELVAFDGGELQALYDRTAAAYEDSAEAAETVTARIDKVESVADALFDEWQDELEEYTNSTLRRQSEAQLKQTRRQYQGLLKSMRRAEGKMFPVLAALKDNTLYLKHNLNAQAVGAIKGEFDRIQADVEVLIREMNKAIAESDAFIATLES